MTDEDIRSSAIDFAKKNKVKIAKQLTNPALYLPDTTPASVFMAGSPGAGKTEFSKWLIGILEDGKERRVIRIDGDEIRPFIPGYTGGNSCLFQGAVSLVVEKMHDLVLHQKQTFVLDGTLAKYEKAADNITRSLEHNRVVFIFYVYQKPEVAWKFTQARESKEGRNIPKSAFIEQFLGARESVDKIAREFKDKVVIFLVKKDFEKNLVENVVVVGREGVLIDDHIQERYTREELDKKL